MIVGTQAEDGTVYSPPRYTQVPSIDDVVTQQLAAAALKNGPQQEQMTRTADSDLQQVRLPNYAAIDPPLRCGPQPSFNILNCVRNVYDHGLRA